MNKKTTFFVAALVFIGLIVYFTQFQQQFYSWSEDFEVKGENPYDIKVLYELLDQRFNLDVLDDRVTEELSDDENKAKATSYLYIGKNPQYTEKEAWHLKEYVKAGGEAFLITDHIQDSLAEILFYREDCGSATTWAGRNPEKYTSKVLSGFNHPNISNHYYEFQYTYNHFTSPYRWKYVPGEAFCNKRDYPIAALGSFVIDKNNESYINFFRVKVGLGHFYFHTNPIMFSNKFMVDSVGLEYADYVFSHTKSKVLFWDRESLNLPENEKAKRRERPQFASKSPLEYIFSQPALRWSWYMFLLLGALYVLFGAKRRQREIPVLEHNRNTSLEFIETIGRLYFQKQDHKGIIKKQMHLFLAHIRQRYNLVTRDLDDKLIARIAVRSKVDADIVNDIFNAHFKLRKILQKPYSKVSADTLNNFYLLIERFHNEERKTKFEKMPDNSLN
jgi:hypothetical protein